MQQDLRVVSLILMFLISGLASRGFPPYIIYLWLESHLPEDENLHLVLGFQDGLPPYIIYLWLESHLLEDEALDLRVVFRLPGWTLASRVTSSLAYLLLTWDSSPWGWGSWSRAWPPGWPPVSGDDLFLSIFTSDLRVISLRMRFLISCLASRVASSLAYLPLTWGSSPWGWGSWSRAWPPGWPLPSSWPAGCSSGTCPRYCPPEFSYPHKILKDFIKNLRCLKVNGMAVPVHSNNQHRQLCNLFLKTEGGHRTPRLKYSGRGKGCQLQ